VDRNVSTDYVAKEKVDNIRYINTSGRYSFCNGQTTFGQAIFIKNLLNPEQCKSLASHLDEEYNWEMRDDDRGQKDYFITGRWCQQGHATPGDHTYPAGKAGKEIAKLNRETEAHQPMAEIGKLLTPLLFKYKPNLQHLIEQLPEEEKLFGAFPLFMATTGSSKMHRDRNDLVSILILLDSSADCGGGLEIGGTGIVFNWKVGDAIILDSSLLPHGARDYKGDLEKRLVGIWIIHKPVLRVHSII